MYRALLATGLVVVGTTFGAQAFEQTDVLQKPTAPAGVEGGASAMGPLPLDVPDAEPKPESGPTLTLPGLGTIGTLPKFDFGLELLYDQDDTGPAVEDDPADSDIRIRGSVKHKF